LAAVAATSASAPERAQVDAGDGLECGRDAAGDDQRFSAWVPISATAASIDAIERWPPKNDRVREPQHLRAEDRVLPQRSPILRASTSGSRSAA
jgi:hypothetical protein